MKAKIEIIYSYRTGNMLKGEIGELKQKITNVIGDVGAVLYESGDYIKFTILNIENDTIKIGSSKFISFVNENGGIDLNSSIKDIDVKVGETSEEIAVSMTDAVGSWKFKVEEIIQ